MNLFSFSFLIVFASIFISIFVFVNDSNVFSFTTIFVFVNEINTAHGDVSIFKKSIDFLIAFHISFVDIYHSVYIKRRNVNKAVFQLPPPITPNFRGEGS